RLAIDSLKPLGDDLNALLANFRYRFENRLAAAGLRLRWSIDQLPRDPKLTPETILQIMRILQEAISNVLKHAHAHRPCVVARYDTVSHEIRLQISDDGRGFDRKSSIAGEGLSSMTARADRLGARLDIVSDQRVGTHVLLILPLHCNRVSSHPNLA